MRINSISALGLVVLAATSTVSCGGGSSSGSTEESALLRGVFIDSPVAGLSYETPTVSGVTDSDGVFNYREGEAVVFSIGQLALPLVVASEMVTPLDMAESEDVSDSSVANIARLLQSLDEDNDPSNGIVISEAVSESFAEPETYDVTDEAAVDAVVDKAFGNSRDAVSSVAAVSHFIDTLSANSNSEASLQQWQYLVPADSTFQGDTLYIDENSFSLTVDGENHTGNTTINRGVYQLRDGGQKWFVSVSNDDQTQLVCLAQSPKPVTDCNDNLYRVFVEETQAIEFNSELTPGAEPDTGAASENATDNIVEGEASVDTESDSEAVVEVGVEEQQGTQAGLPDQSKPELAGEGGTSPEVTLEELFPECASGTADDDGDGFGWQDHQSCLIQTSGTQDLATDTAAPGEVAGEVEVADVEEAPVVEETVAVIEEASVDSADESNVLPDVEAPDVEANADAEDNNTESVTPDKPGAEAEAPVSESVVEAPMGESVVEAPMSESVAGAPASESVTETLPGESGTQSVDTQEASQEQQETLVEEVSPSEEGPPETIVSQEPDAAGTDNLAPEQLPPLYLPSDITDLIILTGQSNAAALRTAFDASLDGGHERLFAYAEDGQWNVADLHQAWDASMPGNFSDSVDGQEPYNNLVFQIGKSIAEQSDRVVGIILVSAPGEGISHWDYNSYFYQKVQARVIAALEALPQKSSVDAVMWMQGETDWLFEGTADKDATGFSSTDSDFYRNYYPNKLSQFIANLRSEWWFGSQAKFICGETKKAELNPHLMALNNDSDALTGCAQASDLPVRTDDTFGNHFSAEALRILGGRIADIYLAD